MTDAPKNSFWGKKEKKMKTAKNAMILIAISLLTANMANADSPKDLEESWIGNGEIFDKHKNLLCPYVLSVSIKKTAKGEIYREVTIKFPDGKQKAFGSTYSGNDTDGWKISGPSGTGSSHCFGNEICHETTIDKDGRTTLNTILKMSETEIQLFRVDIVDGKVANYYHDKLKRMSN